MRHNSLDGSTRNLKKLIVRYHVHQEWAHAVLVDAVDGGRKEAPEGTM